MSQQGRLEMAVNLSLVQKNPVFDSVVPILNGLWAFM